MKLEEALKKIEPLDETAMDVSQEKMGCDCTSIAQSWKIRRYAGTDFRDYRQCGY